MTGRPAGIGAVGQTGQVIRIARVACSAVMMGTYAQTSAGSVADPVGVLLLCHFLWAIAAALIVRRWWWLDPRIAPAETLGDLLVVSVALYATDVLLSPFFIFGVPLFMSALLRWGWREAVIVAAAFVAVYVASIWIGSQQRGADIDHVRLLARVGGFTVLVAVAAWLGRRRRAVVLRGLRIVAGDRDRTHTLLVELCRLVGADAVTLATVHDRRAVSIRSTDPAVDGIAPRFAPEQLLAMSRRFLFQLDPPRKVIDRGWLFGRASLSRRLGAYEVLASLNAERGLAVPIRAQGVQGVVLISRIRTMGLDLLDLTSWIAAQVTAALLDDLRFRSDRRESLMEARLRAAQDVHDTVVQALAGTIFRLEALKSWIGAGREPAGEIDRLIGDVRSAQSNVRDYIGRLRTDGDSGAPCDLLGEIRAAADRSSRTWGIACLALGPRAPVPGPAWFGRELAMLVGEAASNAARHGGASEVTVRLALRQDEIELIIEDNGSGFPTAPDASARPWSINDRIHALGGTLTLQSSGGTRMVMNIPFEEQDDET
ncbi:histidine kinase [Sphingomonas sp. MG17]|uniref:Histidine kinase n=1 Tax=Sphingomonas tagetis TaxID=2949092 RepID=A0A9X2HI40_9SPHN|nr:histidine kinase [Sphingomonas tagetis]MCP3729554.1 histidine kinase [Sphingomonas tagetis]